MNKIEYQRTMGQFWMYMTHGTGIPEGEEKMELKKYLK